MSEMRIQIDPSGGGSTGDDWLGLWTGVWSGVWVGVLAALATGLVLSLVGIAIGAHLAPNQPARNWNEIGMGAMIFAILATFVSFGFGGWVAARLTGVLKPESATLQGAIVWLVAVPLLVIFAALGAGSFFGAWFSGLGAAPAWVARPEAAAAAAAADPQAAIAARNAALGAVTGLLIALMGSAIGGWLGSMGNAKTYYERTRRLTPAPRP